MSKRINVAFSGLMLAGKDHVARMVNAEIRGFADPIYELAEHFFGTRDKSVPGVRRGMQEIGQWGWGCIDEQQGYIWSMDRANTVHLVRKGGALMTKNFGWLNWQEYGTRTDFWVNALLVRIGLRPLPSHLDLEKHPDLPDRILIKTDKPIIAVTNARFSHEMEPLRDAGFLHYHVQCSEETRRERMAAIGYVPNEKEAGDRSEWMAQEFNRNCSHDRVIWNDHRPMPEGKRFLSVGDFRALLSV